MEECGQSVKKGGQEVLWSHNHTNFILCSFAWRLVIIENFASSPSDNSPRRAAVTPFCRSRKRRGSPERVQTELIVQPLILAGIILYQKLDWLSVLKICFQGAFTVKCFRKSREGRRMGLSQHTL